MFLAHSLVLQILHAGQVLSGACDLRSEVFELLPFQSPCQNPVVERLVGSIRRECLDHVIVLHEHRLRRRLTDYLSYYHQHRTHRSLDEDAPESRAVEPPEQGKLIALPMVNGLHHRYARQAAAEGAIDSDQWFAPVRTAASKLSFDGDRG